MEQVTANLSGTTRRELLNGREHLVAPVSLIMPGVLNGSQGPLLYTPEEIAKDPASWNGIPLVVYHPSENGKSVSARNPSVLNRSGIGHIFNTTANGKLAAEGWFDIEKTRKVDSRVLVALESGKPLELSTGLFTDNEPAPTGANHNGTVYSHIARNWRPDHVAILPDRLGACSVNDGCGVNVNESKHRDGIQPHAVQTIWQKLGELLGVTNAGNCGTGAGGFQEGNTCAKGGPSTDSESELESKILDHLKSGRLDLRELAKATGVKAGSGQDPLKSPLNKALVKLRDSGKVKVIQGAFGPPTFEINERSWYELVTNAQPSDELEITAEKACQILKDGEVHGKTLTKAQRGMFGVKCGEREETNNEGQCGSDCDCDECKEKHKEPVTMALKPEDKKALIDNLITNSPDPKPWVESDRQALNALPDDKLIALGTARARLVANAEIVSQATQAGLVVNGKIPPHVLKKIKGKDPDDDEDEEDEEDEDDMETNERKLIENCEHDKPKINVAAPMTKTDWMKMAPPEIRQVVNEALAFNAERKQQLIAAITENERNQFTPQQLQGFDIPTLERLSALAAPAPPHEMELIPHYHGAAAPVANVRITKPEPLGQPQWDWEHPHATQKTA